MSRKRPRKGDTVEIRAIGSAWDGELGTVVHVTGRADQNVYVRFDRKNSGSIVRFDKTEIRRSQEKLF